MEFRLNKVEPEVRRKLKEKLKEGKIHTKEGVALETSNYRGKNRNNFKQYKHNEENSFREILNNDKKIIVDAYKVDNIKIEATKDETNDPISTNRGEFIDVRK